ncbi:MAG: nodulation protein NfeD [Gammaproteobacteria bacterium]
MFRKPAVRAQQRSITTTVRLSFYAVLLAWSVYILAAPQSADLQASNPGSATQKTAVYITIKGAIGPATLDYFETSLEKAIDRRASLFIIRMDTPGGLDTSMREIIKLILSSPIPVVTYVSPSGARAASAGTYIMYASHFAAMTPATNLGAATPVQIGGSNPLPETPDSKKDKQKGKQQAPEPAGNSDTMRHKVINDAVAYIRGLAELRGRNADWAEKAVRRAASLSATEALKKNVIDFIATDMADLLKQLNGQKVSIHDQETVLNTQGVVLQQIEPDWRNQLLSIITDPNVAYILMLIGIYGLIFEFSNPGAIIPGVAGAIALFLALFAFQVLPVNYAGFGLIILGVILMVAEAFVPSFGALGFGGVVAFVIGSIILMDTDAPGFGVSLPLIGAVALVSSGFFTIVLVMALKSRNRPVVSGQEQMIGAVGEAMNDFDKSGSVYVHSEIWSATTNAPLTKGQKVKVTSVEGLKLTVEPVTENKQESTS